MQYVTDKKDPGERKRLLSFVHVPAALALIEIVMFSFFFSSKPKAQEFRAATEAPAAWIEFAGNLRARSEAVLRSEDETALRFQAALEKIKAAGGDAPPPVLTVKVWITASGQVERVSFMPLSNAEADTDLRDLLKRVSAGAPPAGMLQPVRLQLSLQPRN